jgi:hypothetical protein
VDFVSPADENGEVRSTASFRLIGSSGLTAQAVTDELSISPSRSHEVGDPITRDSGKVRESSIWVLKSSDTIENGVELATQLERLLTVFEPVTAELNHLVAKGYRANWLCFVASDPAEHSVELSRLLLARLLTLPGDLWLDVDGNQSSIESPKS